MTWMIVKRFLRVAAIALVVEGANYVVGLQLPEYVRAMIIGALAAAEKWLREVW